MQRTHTVAIATIAIMVAGLTFALDEKQEYGSCVVVTDRDYFTDKVTGHIMLCGDIETTAPVLALSCLSSRTANLVLSDGGHHTGDNVQVRCRFDGDAIYYEGEWEGVGGSGVLMNSRVGIKDILDGVARAGGLAFQISNKDVQHIDFDDGGLRAVDDLRNRCAYWLDLEPHRTARELPDCFPECDRKDLRGADFSRGALFGGKFEAADLVGADFSRSTSVASSGHAVLRLSSADLTGADLTEANLRGASLDHAKLDGANLQRAYLGNAFMLNASLRGANLTDADLSNAMLQGVDLTDAIFHGANLYGVRGCDTSARLVGCVPISIGLEWRAVHGHTGLTGEQ